MKNDRRMFVKSFRCNVEEAVFLAREADREKISEGAFMRKQIFSRTRGYVPEEYRDMIGQLIFEVYKVGNNVDQVANEVNIRKNVTAYDIKRLTRCLEEIREACFKIYGMLAAESEYGKARTSAKQGE